jgi:hypothetical protein
MRARSVDEVIGVLRSCERERRVVLLKAALFGEGDDKRPAKPRKRTVLARPPDGLRTKAEAAAKLGCSIKTLNAHVDARELRSVTIGHGKKRPRKRFTDADLNDFIANQTVSCPSTASRARHTGISTSSGEVIAFTAQPRPRTNAKPRK